MDRRSALLRLAGFGLGSFAAACHKTAALSGLTCAPALSSPLSAGTDRALATTDAAVVRSTQEFYEALRAGRNYLRIGGTIALGETVDLADYSPNQCFILEGSGGAFADAQIVRAADGPAPLLVASWKKNGRQRDWEFRIRGLVFDGLRGRYPNGGPSLALEYAQLSLFDDLRFCDHGGDPFIVGGETLSASEFRDILLDQNVGAGRLRAASDVRWRGGIIQAHQSGRGLGLEIEGVSRSKPDSYPAPGLIEDVHMELAQFVVRGMDDLTVRGGYYYYARADFNDCRGTFQFNPNGAWRESHAYRDGRELSTVACG